VALYITPEQLEATVQSRRQVGFMSSNDRKFVTMITEGPYYIKMASQILHMIMKMGEKVDIKGLFENKKP
jgi:hypothetical protein